MKTKKAVKAEKQPEKVPDGDKNAFETLLKRAVPEVDPPEDETSGQASS